MARKKPSGFMALYSDEIRWRDGDPLPKLTAEENREAKENTITRREEVESYTVILPFSKERKG